MVLNENVSRMTHRPQRIQTEIQEHQQLLLTESTGRNRGDSISAQIQDVETLQRLQMRRIQFLDHIRGEIQHSHIFNLFQCNDREVDDEILRYIQFLQ